MLELLNLLDISCQYKIVDKQMAALAILNSDLSY